MSRHAHRPSPRRGIAKKIARKIAGLSTRNLVIIIVAVGIIVAGASWGIMSATGMGGSGSGIDGVSASGAGAPVTHSPRPTPSMGVVDKSIPVNILATSEQTDEATAAKKTLTDAGFTDVSIVTYSGGAKGTPGTTSYFASGYSATAREVANLLKLDVVEDDGGDGYIRAVLPKR